MVNELILFLLTYVVVFIIYQVLIVSKTKKKKEAKDKSFKDPVEVLYLVNKYKLNMKKVNYNQLLQIVALVSSFDIALVISIMVHIPNFFLEILVGIISVILVILISYHFVYLFYKKKGMIKND